MTALDDLKTARDTLAAAIKDNAGKPDYSVDGQSVSWSSVYKQLADLNNLIAEQDRLIEVVEFVNPIGY